MARVLFHLSRPRDPRSGRHTRGGAVAAAPMSLMRWLAPAALAAALGATALAMPAPARAGDDLVRVLVDVADVIFRTGTPYYRDEYGRYQPLLVVRGPYGPQYYRHLPRGAYRDHRGRDRYGERRVECNRHGKCKVKYTYYDPRYDRDRYGRDRWRDRDWHDDRDWRDRDRRWYGHRDRDDHDDDRQRVRYRLIRPHDGD
jgi:hypothetical protein